MKTITQLKAKLAAANLAFKVAKAEYVAATATAHKAYTKACDVAYDAWSPVWNAREKALNAVQATRSKEKNYN